MQTGSNDAARGNDDNDDDDDDDDYRPIYLRVTDIQRKRNEDMHALRHKVQVTDADLTFHPKINRKSAILASPWLGTRVCHQKGVSGWMGVFCVLALLPVAVAMVRSCVLRSSSYCLLRPFPTLPPPFLPHRLQHTFASAWLPLCVGFQTKPRRTRRCPGQATPMWSIA